MNELSNWILNWILGCVVLVLLAPIFHMADQELHRWSVITVSQFNTGLTEPTFTAFQVIIGLMFALAVIDSYKSDR